MLKLFVNIISLICAGALFIVIKSLNLPALVTGLMVAVVTLAFLFVLAGVFTRKQKATSTDAVGETCQKKLGLVEQ